MPPVERMRTHRGKCDPRHQRTEESPGPSATTNQKTQGTLPFKSSKPYDQHAIDKQITRTLIFEMEKAEVKSVIRSMHATIARDG